MSNPLMHKQRWLILGVILLLSMIIFYPSMGYDFVNWDDGQVVKYNSIVHLGLSGEMLTEAFSNASLEGQYYPITLISYAFNYEFWELDASGYHLLNVLLHLLNTVLLFLILLKLFNHTRLAALVTLLFAIHPMHIEPVAWVASRKDVLYLFFMLCAWWAYLQFRAGTKQRWIWMAGAVLLMAVSGLSKGAAVVFPFVLLATDYLQERKDWKQVLFEKTPFFVLTILFTVVGYLAEQTADAVRESHGIESLFYGAFSFMTYVVKSLLPINLAAYHPYPVGPGEPLHWYIYASIVPAIALVGAAIWFGRKHRKVAFGAALFVFGILPFLQIIGVGRSLTAERFTYFPYVGLFLLMALGVEALLTKFAFSPSKKQPQPTGEEWKWNLGVLVLIIPFLVMSWQHLRTWATGETLWTQVIEVHPTSALAYKNRADFYLNAQQLGPAEQDLNACISFDPSFPMAHNNRGLIYLNTGRQALAHSDFTLAIQQDPTDHMAWYNRGLVSGMQGNFIQALPDLTQAITLSPTHANYYMDRGKVHQMQKNHSAAVQDFTQVLSLAPEFTDAFVQRSYAQFDQGNLEAAKADLLSAEAMGIQFPPAYRDSLGM